MKIIQIGCNNGKDHVYDYIISHPPQNQKIESIVLIDANINALDECKKTYQDIKNVQFINAAIVGDDTKNVVLFFPSNSVDSEHSSIYKEQLILHKHTDISAVEVEAIHINDILSSYYPIDRLYVDAEGVDIEIVFNINYNKYKIPYIYFEYAHSDGAFTVGKNLDLTIERLKFHNYNINIIGSNIEAEYKYVGW